MQTDPPNPTVTWDGPPLALLGQCYVCLLVAHQRERDRQLGLPSTINQAVTLVKGTGVCPDHLTHIANTDLLAVLP